MHNLVADQKQLLREQLIELFRAHRIPSLHSLQHLAQDQLIITLIKGSCLSRYSARHLDTKDIQSDAVGQRGDFSHLFQRGAIWKRDSNDDEVLDRAEFEFSSSESQICDEDIDAGEHCEDLSAEEIVERIFALDLHRASEELRRLIAIAEDMQFSVEQSLQLSPRLLEIALRFRNSTALDDRPLVTSAIRTGASMFRPAQVEQLIPLLTPGFAVDTTLVTVKMIGRIFEAQPPGTLDEYSNLSDQLSCITDSVLNPYAISSSQSAALAQLAIFALAAMASTHLEGAIARVGKVGQQWFSKQLARDLQNLMDAWAKLKPPVNRLVRDNLQGAIDTMAQCGIGS